MTKSIRFIWLSVFTFFCTSRIYSAVIINELLASNASILADEKSQYDDWVEFYNNGKDTVSLAGMYLTNDLKKKDKWRFPSNMPQLTNIPPKGFLLVWCDKDLNQDSFLHAGFKLDGDGGAFYLIDEGGKQVKDSVKYPDQYLDFSYGRMNEGKEWSYFLLPTPLKPNEGASKITQVCPEPVFTVQKSFFHDSAWVAISVPEGFEVRYTMNGSEPIASGALYTSSFPIFQTTVVRARAFREGYLHGKIASKTFFINEDISLPIISIIANSSNLWSSQGGIYTNPFKEIEAPAHFEYLKNGDDSIYAEDVAIRIFGNTSRNSSKQSFAILSKEKFGSDRLNYSFFPDKPEVKSVDGIILRGDVTSGRGGGDRETAGERVKNELMYQINREAGKHCDVQAYQPVVLFLNGNYWGLYNLMERKGVDFIKNNHRVEEIDMLNSYLLDVVEGDTIHYQRMLDYIERNNLEEDEKIKPLYSWVDVESLIDYWLFEIYSATHDYAVNIRMWRPRIETGKWRWIAYDEDSWGAYEETTLDDITYEDEAENIFLIAPMLENEAFRIWFINRHADLLNSVLSAENIQRLIEEIQLVIKDEKVRDYDRWKNLVHFVEPGSQISSLNEFAEKRPAFMRQEIMERFETDTVSVMLNVSGNGKLIVNTIQPASFPWKGIYFQEIPITITAIPAQGHHFKGWSDANLSSSETITLKLKKAVYQLEAHFD